MFQYKLFTLTVRMNSRYCKVRKRVNLLKNRLYIEKLVMHHREILIIGAGTAGLMCARELATAGHQVLVIEARDRMGGRIHTITNNLFPLPVELGAEFVHGDLSLTKELLKEGAIEYYAMEGEMWRSEKGSWIDQDEFMEHLDLVVKRLKTLQTDMNIADFLQFKFKDEKYDKLRKKISNYVEGYDAADTKQASAYSLLEELQEEDNEQYRIKGGYKKLIDYLTSECIKAGCIFKLQTVAKKINWQKGHVNVFDQNGECFTAKKIVITLSLGVLQSPPESIGNISFSPAIPEVSKAIALLGYGNVIKIILLFDEPIWNHIDHIEYKNKLGEPSFFFSEEVIPTWWTQLPEKNGMITGWLAGPKATTLQNESEDPLLELALESLSHIFQIPQPTLKSKLIASQVSNWGKDSFSRGAYSFETIESKSARRIIAKSVDDTLYFAGEAYHEGPQIGTVEAALVSGKKIANQILQTATM